MKKYKLVGIILAFAICFTLAACGNANEPANQSYDKPSSQEVAAAQSVVEEYCRACYEKDSPWLIDDQGF